MIFNKCHDRMSYCAINELIACCICDKSINCCSFSSDIRWQLVYERIDIVHCHISKWFYISVLTFSAARSPPTPLHISTPSAFATPAPLKSIFSDWLDCGGGTPTTFIPLLLNLLSRAFLDSTSKRWSRIKMDILSNVCWLAYHPTWLRHSWDRSWTWRSDWPQTSVASRPA